MLGNELESTAALTSVKYRNHAVLQRNTLAYFLVELPEHALCDRDSTDVLRNTRSITGSPLTTWFTNGNNLHVEHHAAMTVPMNRLRARHGEVQRTAENVEPTYLGFYWRVAKAASGRSEC